MFFWICCMLFFYRSFFNTHKLSMVWWTKSWRGHSTWDVSLLYINYMFAKFFHKLPIHVLMESELVNMDITFLTFNLRLPKSTFFHMKTSQHGDLEYFGWLAASTNIAASWSHNPGTGKHFSKKLGLYVVRRSSVWFFLEVKLTNWSKFIGSSVSRNDSLRTFGYWLGIIDWVSQSISSKVSTNPYYIIFVFVG